MWHKIFGLFYKSREIHNVTSVNQSKKCILIILFMHNFFLKCIIFNNFYVIPISLKFFFNKTL